MLRGCGLCNHFVGEPLSGTHNLRPTMTVTSRFIKGDYSSLVEDRSFLHGPNEGVPERKGQSESTGRVELILSIRSVLSEAVVTKTTMTPKPTGTLEPQQVTTNPLSPQWKGSSSYSSSHDGSWQEPNGREKLKAKLFSTTTMAEFCILAFETHLVLYCDDTEVTTEIVTKDDHHVAMGEKNEAMGKKDRPERISAAKKLLTLSQCQVQE